MKNRQLHIKVQFYQLKKDDEAIISYTIGFIFKVFKIYLKRLL